MPELKFLNKNFTSQLSTNEIKQIVDSLEEGEILEKATTDDGFRIVTKANDHFGYGLTFTARLEEKNNGRTDVTIKTPKSAVYNQTDFESLVESKVGNSPEDNKTQ